MTSFFWMQGVFSTGLFTTFAWDSFWLSLLLISPSPEDALCQVWLKLAQWLWRRRYLNFRQIIYFRYFLIISPWKGAGSFIWTNLNPLHPRMLCAKFGWNWPSGSEEEDENVKVYDNANDDDNDWQRTKS